jgi:acyl carrier protein
MNRPEIYSKVSGIFADLFLVDDIALDDGTTADQVDGWDSLTHINLMIAVESEFGFKFDLGEIEKFKAVGDLVDAIERHLD